MSLDPRYIPLYNLQQYFVDKTTGAPLANGRVYFFSDNNRSVPKTVYELSSTTGTYTYVPLPNPVLLSSVGTPVDVNGNDIVIYAFPFNVITGDSELYYVRVEDSLGRPQLTREAVPSSAQGSTPGNDSEVFNYIPNGQFLAHTNVPGPDNRLVAGSNIIAQGGFSIELADVITSQNTLEFVPLPFTDDPPNSPRFIAKFSAVTFSGTENRKNFRIKFNDVNKFSSNEDVYTFCFWAESNVTIPISIQIVKYFGTLGSIVTPVTVFTDAIIANDGRFYQYQIQFGLNTGLIVDTENNNDFVAIDIAFPLDIPFSVDLTDFILANGDIEFVAFPLQTNADMITRGVDGWTDVPAYDGSDLGLPKVLTRYGYQYSDDDIGDIGQSVFPIVSPLSTIPLPKGNKMPADGAAYISSENSTNGIPFNRLGTELIVNSPVPNVPMYGTGADYATSYTFAGDDTKLRLSVNTAGTGIPAASDGNTGWDIGGVVTYGGSSTGSASIGFLSSNTSDSPFLLNCFGSFLTPVSAVSAQTTPFTFSTPNITGNIRAFQSYFFQMTTTAASTLIAGSGNAGDYWRFSNGTIQYYMWFYFNGEVDPVGANPGRTGIRVDLDSSYTAQDVANVIREVMNAYQDSVINVTSVPTAGQYWMFSTNPGLLRSFYVWYSFTDADLDPMPGGIGIEVRLSGSDAVPDVVLKTQLAINSYQYAAPDFRGMFLRGADFDGTWDLDVLERWSNVTGLSGANLGTFEFQQLLDHFHEITSTGDLVNPGGGTGPFDGGNNNPFIVLPDTEPSGGSETRPVNTYVNFYIKY